MKVEYIFVCRHPELSTQQHIERIFKCSCSDMAPMFSPKITKPNTTKKYKSNENDLEWKT